MTIGGGGRSGGGGASGSWGGSSSTSSTTTQTTQASQANRSTAYQTPAGQQSQATTSTSQITSTTPIATAITGGVITAGGQIVSQSQATQSPAAGSASYVANIASQTATQQLKAQTATQQPQSTTQQAQIANPTLRMAAERMAQQEAMKPEVYIHPIAARALGINVGLDQYVPAEVVAQQQTKINPEGFRQMIAAEKQRAQALNQARVLYYDIQTGQWGSAAGDVARSASANIKITELKNEQGAVSKFAEVEVGGQKKLYQVVGKGERLEDYYIIQEVNKIPLPEEKQQLRTPYVPPREKPAFVPANLEAGQPGITPMGVPYIPISKQKLQTRIDEAEKQITPENVYFEYNTQSGQLRAYAKTFVSLKEEGNRRTLITEPNKLIYEGSLEEFTKKYPSFKDLPEEASIKAAQRTHRTITNVEGLPSYIKGFSTFGYEVTGLIERHYAELSKPPKYDVKITYGGLEKAASFRDPAYSVSYFAPSAALHFTPVGIGARNLGGVGTIMEGARGLAFTTGISVAAGTAVEGIKSVATGKEMTTEGIKKSAATFFVSSIPISAAGSLTGQVASTFIRAEKPLTFIGKNIATGAATGAIAGGTFWAVEGGRPSETASYIGTGALIGGGIGLASAGYSLIKANELAQKSDFIVRFKVGEETKITEATAKLPKPYRQDYAVVSGSGQPVDVGYNIGKVRIEYNPLLERVGISTKGKFYGLELGRLRPVLGEAEHLGYLRVQQLRPLEPLSRSAVGIYRNVALEQSTKATLAEGKGLWLRPGSTIMEIDEKLTNVEKSIPILQQKVQSGNVVNVPERLTLAEGSKFTQEQAKAFVDAVKGRTLFYGRGTYPYVSSVKDIDVRVYGAFTKEGAQSYLIEAAKKQGLQVTTKEGNLLIQGVKFDVHPAFEGYSYGMGATTDLIGFGYRAPPLPVEGIKGTGVYVMHPAETLFRKTATTSYMFKDALITEQRRQKDVFQLREMFKLTQEQKELTLQSSQRSNAMFTRTESLSMFPSSTFSSSQVSFTSSTSKSSLIDKSVISSFTTSPKSYEGSISRSISYPSRYYPVSSSISVPPSRITLTTTQPPVYPPSRPPYYPRYPVPPSYPPIYPPSRPPYTKPPTQPPTLPPLLPPIPQMQPKASAFETSLKVNVKKRYTPSVIAIVAGITTKKEPKMEKLTPFDLRPVVLDQIPKLFLRGGKYKRR